MENADALSRLEQRLARERKARAQAEAIAEQGLRELYLSQRKAELLQRVASAAVDGSTLETVLAIGLTGICDLCGWPVGHMYMVEDSVLRSAGVWCGGNMAARETMRAATATLDLAGTYHLPGRVVASGQPAWIADVEQDSGFVRRDAARAVGLRGAAAFPLWLHQRVAGVAEFFGPERAEPDAAQSELVAHVLLKVGVVIERQQAEAELKAAKRQLDAALTNMSQGLCLYDAAHELRLHNARFAAIYGLPALRAGLTHEAVLDAQAMSASGPADSGQFRRMRRDIAASATASYTNDVLRDGRIIGISHQPMPGGGWVETHEDITETRRTQARLTHLAHYDALTDLPNRLLFHDRLAHALTQAQRRDGGVALLCLDLDRFKDVNDTLGHKLGDELLRNVAARLRASVRDSDTVARLGGDEFAIVQTDPVQPAGAVALANRVLAELSLPYDLQGHQVVVVAASIGIALAPRDGADADTLMRNADLAMYRAKANGRGCYAFFEPSMHAAMQARLALELDLRRALQNNEFMPFYQPVVDPRSRAVTGFEALLRWHHPERGMVQPNEFIPLAEEIGMIGALGARVLRLACADAARWSQPVTVAVNISPLQFRGDLYTDVTEALNQSGLDPARLELEITESVLLSDSETTLTTLRQIKALGVRIAMDDFGTGYSSLSYLRKFPFDRVKIDRSFIRELGQRADTVAIVRSVLHLCHSLGMATTAEGVETEWQLAEISDCTGVSIQGFLFGRPIPAQTVEKVLDGAVARNAAPVSLPAP